MSDRQEASAAQPQRLGSFCAGVCPTPTKRHGFPIGECPVCGSFWIIRWGGTVYGYARISAEDYKAWLAANGYGPQFNGQTTLPNWNQMPNVKVLVA